MVAKLAKESASRNSWTLRYEDGFSNAVQFPEPAALVVAVETITQVQ
jgi:hypothetical protein